MELTTLGSLTLRDSEFTERKPLLLLAYLALRGRRTRGDVAEALWPDADPDLQRKSLSEALRKLRRLGPEAVLEPAADALATALACDAARLDARAAAAPGEDPVATAEALVEAYPAPFLDGLESDRRLRLGGEMIEWLLETREALHDAVAGALLRCAERLARRGAFLDAAELAARIDALPDVPVFPTPEELQRRHTLLLAGNDRAAATAVATRARDAYGEIGLAPDPATARASLDVRRALPPVPLHFDGRNAEGEALLARLHDTAVRAVQICGHPGIGKSALAAAVAGRARALGTFPGGVAFVSLEPLEPGSDESQATEYLASALALDPPRDDAAALARALGDGRQLLVLDAAEQLAHLPELPTALLRHSGTTLLLASRTRLEIDGAATVVLEGLEHPERDVGEDRGGAAEATAAERLFREVAAERGVPLQEADAAAIRRIAAAVEGNPLALRLAAGWSASVPVTDIAERLERSWELFEGTPLEQALTDVRSALGDEERRTLLQIGAHRGGFAAADADALDIGAAALRRLVAFDLLRFDAVRERYELHAVVEREAAERLAERPDAHAILDQHARHYLDRLGELISKDPAVRSSAPRRLWSDAANIEAAWRRAVACDGWRALADAAHPLERLAELSGRPRWGAALLAVADEAIGATDTGDARDAERGAIGAARAWLALLTGEYDLGLRLAEEARERLGRNPEAHSTALRTALHAAGAIHDERGAFQEAAKLFEEALELAPDNSPEAATSLLNLAVNARDSGAYRKSNALLRRALAIYRADGREAGNLHAAALLADTLHLDGRPLEALAELDAVAALVERSGALDEQVRWLLTKAEIEVSLDRRAATMQALERIDRIGSRYWGNRFKRARLGARLAVLNHEWDDAERFAADALRIACARRSARRIALGLADLLIARRGRGRTDRRNASLAGFLSDLIERQGCSAEVRDICRELLEADPAWREAAPPPWTEAALGEPAILLERVGLR